MNTSTERGGTMEAMMHVPLGASTDTATQQTTVRALEKLVFKALADVAALRSDLAALQHDTAFSRDGSASIATSTSTSQPATRPSSDESFDWETWRRVKISRIRGIEPSEVS
jgi:hypothetical protein